MSRFSSRALVSILVAIALVTPVSIHASADGGSGGLGVAPPAPDPGTGLPSSLTDAARPLATAVGSALDALRPVSPGAVRILLVSSGVNTGLFPESLRSKIHLAWDTGDVNGYGTYAASILLQVLPQADITSVTTYQYGKFNSAWQESDLDWAIGNASNFDAVLYAVPPWELVDPVTLLLASGDDTESQWTTLLGALGDNPLAVSGNEVLGLAADTRARMAQIGRAAPTQGVAMQRWYDALRRWEVARRQVSALAAAGLPVVAPAGDLGPNFQTIFGIPNFADVVAVGAYDGQAVSATSSSGPSLDLKRAKPDVVAHSAIPGLVPEGTPLAALLPEDPSLTFDFPGGVQPAAGERVRVGSTFPAAAVVAAQLGSLASQGIRDPRVLRGALMSAATPLPGVPVWRQGAGLIERPVSADEVRARGVALDPADLGREPASGDWSTHVGFWNATPRGARTGPADFAGVDLDGSPLYRSAVASPVRVSVENGGVTLRSGMGEEWEAGVFCGYTNVALPRSSGDARPAVSGDGMPEGARENVPTCLVNGSQVRLHAFYIHDQPAENMTWAILPDIPERDSITSGLPKQVELDPFHEGLFQKVTDQNGDAVLTNVPPGYYRFREFSDYGSPISFSVRAPGGATQTLEDDIGMSVGYQDIAAWLVSATGLTGEDLEARFGAQNVRHEGSGAWVVNLGGARTIRIVIDYLKKMPGPAVSSRYVDLITRSDFSYILAEPPTWLSDLGTPGGLAEVARPLVAGGWAIEGVNAPAVSSRPEAISGVYNGTLVGATAASGDKGALLAVAQYPFTLTTPNYNTKVSLNFRYNVQNAAVFAIVQIGGEVGIGYVMDNAVAHVEGSSLVPNVTLTPTGHSGVAGFNFNMLSRGISTGTLTLVLVPEQALSDRALPVSRATVDELSMNVATWVPATWPAADTAHGHGHLFGVNPNLSNMNHPECRGKNVRGYAYTECEDWTVLVHTPGDDASLMGVHTQHEEVTEVLREHGGAFFDPRRGVHDFSSVWSHALTIEEIAAGISLPKDFRTNGRFWEQMVLPFGFLKAVPDPLGFHIVDNMMGRESGIAPHSLGSVPVVPYLTYQDTPNHDIISTLV